MAMSRRAAHEIPALPPLALERVRYVGDPVVLVVAETLDQATDVAEAVMVDYDPLPSITDTAKTVDKDAPRVWDDYPDNVSGLYQAGDKAATDKAFEHAHRIVKRRFTISCVFAHYMETRGAIGSYDPREDRFLLYADVQYPHRVRQLLAEKISAFLNRISALLPVMSAAVSAQKVGNMRNTAWYCGHPASWGGP